MDTREEATAFLRRMEEARPADWLNRLFWPAEERAAYETWEHRELDRKAEAERQEAEAKEAAEAAAQVDAIAPDPPPATPPEPGAPGDQRSGR